MAPAAQVDEDEVAPANAGKTGGKSGKKQSEPKADGDKKKGGRQAKATEPVRARRKNRETGSTIAIVDGSLVQEHAGVTFDPDKGRWAVISEESKEFTQVASFAEACIVARTPSAWSKKEAKLKTQVAKDREAAVEAAEKAKADRAAAKEQKAKEKAAKEAEAAAKAASDGAGGDSTE
jgi:hypothetical protein